KRILVVIDSDSTKKEWTRRAYRIALRKFVKWLREEHGYPKDYPDAKRLTKILPLIKYPDEVLKIKVGKVNKLKPRDEIPTQEEMRFLREASLNSRDKAYFAVSEELGPRIGGIGTRKIKHVEFDDLGAKIYMEDKTMEGEPVQLVWSASYLREWWESHPFKHDPEAPLWINFTIPDRAVPLDYYGFRRMIQRTIKRHNQRADANGLPKIIRRIHTHAFRYFAQIRDELEGVPRSVQRKQRGWSVDSNMPDKYAAIVNSDVEEYFRKRYGLSGNENNHKPLACSRCKEVNAVGNIYCRRCGLPLNEKAKKYDGVIDDLIEKI
ncbi:MAG: site-specific integrase, partial [Candidatus Hydrothermarchaeota archaeon]|nr:site-specific integrase [Candidatus Hydrothermarchaeota archaeon]